MRNVNIETVKQQAIKKDRFTNDLKTMGLSFEQCHIVQIDSMDIVFKANTTPPMMRTIQSGVSDVYITLDQEGNMLSWTVPMDHTDLKAERLKRISA
jgi:hypothetical protein